MKKPKLKINKIAVVFVSTLTFSSVGLHFIWQEVFVKGSGNSPFFDNWLMSSVPYFFSLMIALSVVNVIKKLDGTE